MDLRFSKVDFKIEIFQSCFRDSEFEIFKSFMIKIGTLKMRFSKVKIGTLKLRFLKVARDKPNRKGPAFRWVLTLCSVFFQSADKFQFIIEKIRPW